jgi:hypothetical protein
MLWRDDAAAPETLDPFEIALALGGAALTLILVAAIAYWTRAEFRARHERAERAESPRDSDANQNRT